MMEIWRGKVALVTGASCGIGAAIVCELAKAGMIVVGMARRRERLDDLAAGLSDDVQFYPVQGDVTNEDDVERVFEFIRNELGAVDVVVNNAGVLHLGRILSTQSTVWKETLDVNVLGVLYCCKRAYSLMMDAGVALGHIININSIAGHGIPDKVNPMMNIYPASKNALTVLTETLRLELLALGANIKITSLSPGYTETELFHFDQTDDSFMTEQEALAFQQRPRLLAKDVANAVISVLSTPPHVQITQLTIKPVGEPV